MIKSLIIIGVLATTLIVGLNLANRTQRINSEASSFNTRLSLPATSTATVNQTLSLPVMLNTGTAQIRGADVVLQYDKTKLSLKSITPSLSSSSFTYLPINTSHLFDINKILQQSSISGNNQTIEFNLATTSIDNPQPTTFSTNNQPIQIAILTFDTLSTGNTQVSLIKNGASTTDSNIAQADSGLDILDFVDNSLVTISSPSTSTPIPPTATKTPSNSPTLPPSPTPTLTLTPTPTPNPIGYLDDATCATIYGWSCDPNYKNISATVTIKIDGIPLTLVTANQTRTDLSSVCGNTTNHGFSINTPASVFDGQSHTVTASSSINGYVKNLTGSKTLRCVIATVTPRPSPTPTIRPSITPTPSPTPTPIPTSTPKPTATKTPTPIPSTTTFPPTLTPVPTTIPTATAIPTPIPDGWTRCATENNFCAFTGTAQVRYGLFGAYNYGVFTNGVQCANSVFGDPFVGFIKYCDYQLISTPTPTKPPVATSTPKPTTPPQSTSTPKPTTPPAPTSTPTPSSDWIYCAQEREFCSFTGTAEIRYGTLGSYNYGTYTNGVECSNSVFGDPFWGLRKHCDYRVITPAPVPTPTLPILNNVFNIFYNNLDSSWQNWSWDTNVQITDIISTTSNSNNAGLYLRNRNPLPTSQYQYLKFDLKAKQLPTTIRIFAYGQNSNPPLNSGLDISSYGTISTQNFITFKIPLSQLNANQTVYGFSFQIYGTSSSGKTVYLDDIVLSN